MEISTPDVKVVHCPHCPWMEARGITHTKVCHCSHHHSKHIFGGGCAEPGCLCDRYDQSKEMAEEKISKRPSSMPSFAMAGIDADKMIADSAKLLELTEAQERVDKLRKEKDRRVTQG